MRFPKDPLNFLEYTARRSGLWVPKLLRFGSGGYPCCCGGCDSNGDCISGTPSDYDMHLTIPDEWTNGGCTFCESGFPGDYVLTYDSEGPTGLLWNYVEMGISGCTCGGHAVDLILGFRLNCGTTNECRAYLDIEFDAQSSPLLDDWDYRGDLYTGAQSEWTVSFLGSLLNCGACTNSVKSDITVTAVHV